MSTISTPISRQPDILVTNVAHGNRPGRCGHAVASPYRASAPSAPPAETVPSTAHGAPRRRTAVGSLISVCGTTPARLPGPTGSGAANGYGRAHGRADRLPRTAHALGPGVVRAVPAVPAAPGGPARRRGRARRGRLDVPVHPGRPDGRRRRLSGGTPGRGAPRRRARPQWTAPARPVAGPARRGPLLGPQ